MTVRAPVRLSEAGSLAKASTPEPFSTSKTSNWVARRGGLPPYVQHIAHDLMADPKHPRTESEAIKLAIGIVENPPAAWGAEAKAAAAKAAAEWKAKRGTSSPGSAAKSGAKSLAESRRRAPGISLADRVTLRTAAKARLRSIEEAFDIQTMMSLLTEGIGNDWTPALKRTASATSETARMEVHDGGQHVGFVMGRRGYERANPERWRAAGVNGRTVGDMCDTQAGAVDALKKHLEEAPARVSATSSGKHAVAEPEGYGGPTRFTEYPSEATARYAAGLPERPTKPEQTSKVAALGEMIAFDVVTLVGLEEELPSGMGVLQEAGFERAFDEAKHPRGPHGKFSKGDRVNFQHSHFGRVPATVTKTDSRRVHLTSSDPRVSDTSMTHKQAETRLSRTTAAKPAADKPPSETAARNLAAYERNRLSSVTARKSKTVLNPSPSTPKRRDPARAMQVENTVAIKNNMKDSHVEIAHPQGSGNRGSYHVIHMRPYKGAEGYGVYHDPGAGKEGVPLGLHSTPEKAAEAITAHMKKRAPTKVKESASPSVLGSLLEGATQRGS